MPWMEGGLLLSLNDAFFSILSTFTKNILLKSLWTYTIYLDTNNNQLLDAFNILDRDFNKKHTHTQTHTHTHVVINRDYYYF